MTNGILDLTAGGGHMWFDGKDQLETVTLADRRTVDELEHQPSWSCEPDVKCDMRRLPFADSSFSLVAFDPPHRITDEGMKQLSGVIEQKYGALTAETWQSDLARAFREIRRVLTSEGVCTFKWADVHKSHDDVLSVLDWEPLYGVTTEKDRAVTKWWVFHNGC
jgi:ubiquinone/menaquinone biosynthesis C-methylase UbiE